MNPNPEPLTTIYRGVTLTYKEGSDVWECDLFTRGSQSLAKAKERITDLLLKKTVIPEAEFKRFQVWTRHYQGSFRLVTVTSFTDEGEAWITDEKMERKKLSSYERLYTDSESNRAIIKQCLECKQQEDQLSKKRERLVMTLKGLTAKELYAESLPKANG